ncbi:MAG: hypothetical protein ACTSSH_04270 [Candidatus Heimdallarchaeota archaeon]
MVNDKVDNAFTSIKAYITELENKIKNTEDEMKGAADKANLLASEKQSAVEKLRQMENDMQELSSVYEDLKGQKDVEINIQEVMKLYIILTENVLDGSTHIKILTLLHGAKEKMTKDELSKASGIQAVATLRAIFDLRNNGLVEYDEETEKVKLVRRLFS